MAVSEEKSRSVPEGGADFPAAISLPESAQTLATIYRDHLGLSARSPKQVSKRVNGVRNLRKLEKQLVFDCFWLFREAGAERPRGTAF